MLTKLTIRNFKGLKDVEIELGQNVVFVGPNNSGKTTALQALALWYVGLQKWLDVPASHDLDYSLGGTSINRLGLLAIPIPSVNYLWNDLRTHNGENIPIRIVVDGTTNGKEWACPLNFRYANEESFYCSPDYAQDGIWLAVEDEVKAINVVFLPPMSGLSALEPRIELGRINVLIGEGRTAEVLRNLCYQLFEENGKSGKWDKLVGHIREQFGIEILAPNYLPARGEIRMSYRDQSGITLDLSSSGRGMLQVLLLLAYMYNNPGSVLLLDEPDAHLEIIRQREIYNLLTNVAREQSSQIIAASHSEVVLEEAAGRDTAIAFVGKPHRIDRQNKSQVVKALKQIRATDYYLAERTGWVLYLEGSTDFAILQTLARRLNHGAASALENCFTYYLDTNKPSKAADHFQGLHEAKNDLVGIALFDRIPDKRLQQIASMRELIWKRREIENYLIAPETLIAYARQEGDKNRVQVMRDVIQLLVPPIALQNTDDKWWRDTRASEDFLDRVFELYFEKLGLPNLMRKTYYHILANHVPVGQIDPEVIEKLDAILETAKRAKPRID
jgi:energy-coupling factor transporter ATP-binding protein EcfA2